MEYRTAPERLRNCHIINQTAQSAAVMCDAGFGGGITQVFHMEVYDAESMVLVKNETSVERPFFLVKDMKENFNLLLVFYSSNAQGRSEWMSLRLTTKEQNSERSVYITENSKTKFGPFFDAVIGILVGIPCIIGLCLLGLYMFKLRSGKSISRSKRTRGCVKRYPKASHLQKEQEENTKQTRARHHMHSKKEQRRDVTSPKSEVQLRNQTYKNETDPDTDTPLISK